MTETVSALVAQVESYKGYKRPDDMSEHDFIAQAIKELHEFKTNFEHQHHAAQMQHFRALSSEELQHLAQTAIKRVRNRQTVMDIK